MTSAKEIENELESQDIDVAGVVVYHGRDKFHAVGFEAEQLPDVDGYSAIDDPELDE